MTHLSAAIPALSVADTYALPEMNGDLWCGACLSFSEVQGGAGLTKSGMHGPLPTFKHFKNSNVLILAN